MAKEKIKGPVMEPADIVKEYNEAKFKKNQIKILAELNLCSQDEIKRILRENGVALPGGSKKMQSAECGMQNDLNDEKTQEDVSDSKEYSNVNDLKRIDELEAEVAELKETNKDLEDETCDYLKRLSEVESMVDILLSVNFATLESFKGIEVLIRQIKNSCDGVMV